MVPGPEPLLAYKTLILLIKILLQKISTAKNTAIYQFVSFKLHHDTV
jgi:hypothetical protein